MVQLVYHPAQQEQLKQDQNVLDVILNAHSAHLLMLLDACSVKLGIICLTTLASILALTHTK